MEKERKQGRRKSERERNRDGRQLSCACNFGRGPHLFVNQFLDSQEISVAVGLNPITF